MSGTQERSLQHIAAEAAEWFTALRGAELAAGERERFARWLEESPVHVREYLGVAETLGLVAAAQAWPAQSAAELIAATGAPGNVRALRPLPVDAAANGAGSKVLRRRRTLWAAAAVLVAGIGAALFMLMRADVLGQRDYATARGEQRSVVLPDGSVVQLNTLSRIVVRFGARQRRVELPQGEAFFKVARDAARPFDVVTPLAMVRAVGTEFNVYSRERATRVAVIEGRVRVAGGRAGWPVGGAAAARRESLALGAREAVEIDADGRIERHAATATPEQTLAWIQRRLVFENQPLQGAVEEFNRYNRRQLRVGDRGLAALRISAVFDADDPEALVRYLERIQNVRASRSGDAVLLTLHRSDEGP